MNPLREKYRAQTFHIGRFALPRLAARGNGRRDVFGPLHTAFNFDGRNARVRQLPHMAKKREIL